MVGAISGSGAQKENRRLDLIIEPPVPSLYRPGTRG
jgi:hypothetical protein